MRKPRYKLSFLLGCLSLITVLSCQKNPASKEVQHYEKETLFVKEILLQRVKSLPKLSLDSIRINQDTLYTYITDNYGTYNNPVLLTQNFGIIFQDFVQIASAPFSGIKLDYRITKKDSLNFFTFYTGNLEDLKASLHIFTNPSFKDLINGISYIHKKYPWKNLIDRFNSSLSEKLAEDGVDETQFFGANYFDIASMYLVECETRSPRYFKKAVKETIEKMSQDKEIGDAIIKEMIEVFSRNCKEIQEVNPLKKKSQPKPIFI